jgi:hypothetical protein
VMGGGRAEVGKWGIWDIPESELNILPAERHSDAPGVSEPQPHCSHKHDHKPDGHRQSPRR